jgi:hypothetical protein
MPIIFLAIAILVILVLAAALLGSAYANVQIAQAAQSAASAAQLANLAMVLDRAIIILAVFLAAAIIIVALVVWYKARIKAPVTINSVRTHTPRDPYALPSPNGLPQLPAASTDPMQTMQQMMAMQMMMQINERISNRHNNQP